MDLPMKNDDFPVVFNQSGGGKMFETSKEFLTHVVFRVINNYHFGMVGIPPIYGNIQDGYKNGFTTWKTWNLAESITHVNPKNLMQHIWKRPGDLIMLAHHYCAKQGC